MTKYKTGEKHVCDDKCYHPEKRVKAKPVLPKEPKKIPLVDVDFAGDTSDNNTEFVSTTASTESMTFNTNEETPNWKDVANTEIEKQIKESNQIILKIDLSYEKIFSSKNTIAIEEADTILRTVNQKLLKLIKDKEIG